MRKTKLKIYFQVQDTQIAFLNSVINNFESKKHDPMILRYLYKNSEFKPTDLIDVPFFNKNEKSIKKIIKKIEYQRKLWL